MKKSLKIVCGFFVAVLAFLSVFVNLIMTINAEDAASGIITSVFAILKFVLPVLLIVFIFTLIFVLIFHRKKAKNKAEILENKADAEKIYKKNQEKDDSEVINIEPVNIADEEVTKEEILQEKEDEPLVEDEIVKEEVVEEPVVIEELNEEEKLDDAPIETHPNKTKFISGMFRHDDVYFAPIFVNLEEEEEEEEEEEVVNEEVQEEEEDFDTSAVAMVGSGKLKREAIKRHFLTKFSVLDKKQRDLYSELKNEFLSYKGVRSRISHSCESFKYRGDLLAKITINGKIIKLHINLNPDEFNYYKYFQVNEGDRKAYQEVPMTVKVKSERGVKNAGVLFGILMDKIFVEKSKRYIAKDYSEYNGPLHFSTLVRENCEDIIVGQVGANETANYISDELAEKLASQNKEVVNINISQYEKKVAIVNTGDLEEAYKPYESVTLTSLKSRKLIDSDVTFVELHAKGELTKPLDVRLQSYSLPALKMVLITGGNLKIRELY